MEENFNRAIDSLAKRVDGLQEEVKHLHIATEQYKQAVVTLTKRVDSLEQIGNTARDIGYEVRALKEKVLDVRAISDTNAKKLETLDDCNIEMETKMTHFANVVNTQLAEIKEMVSQSNRLHKHNEQEIAQITRRLENISWVDDLGSQFKKSVIAFIVSMILFSMGLYYVGYKAIFDSKGITKQEIKEILQELNK